MASTRFDNCSSTIEDENASTATQRQILGSRFPSVLSGNDVIKRKREKRIVLLVDAAILTAVASPIPNEFSQCLFHGEALSPFE